MVPLQMGIKGAAFGTGIGYMIPAVIGLWFFSAKKGSLYFRKPVLDFSVLAESCTNGFSEMVSQAATAVTTFLFNHIMMKLLGENGVAAITIIIYTQFLLSALYIGFSMGAAPVISYNYGKQDEKQLKNVFCICMRFIAFVSISVFTIAFIFGSPLVGIFTEKGTPVYEIARNGFLIFPFSFLFCGLNIFTSATFTALSNGKLSAILSFLRTFGLITVLLLSNLFQLLFSQLHNNFPSIKVQFNIPDFCYRPFENRYILPGKQFFLRQCCQICSTFCQRIFIYIPCCYMDRVI